MVWNARSSGWRAATGAIATAGFLFAGGESAISQRDMPVDVELVLAVDVSRSMMPEELDIQRRGYVEALTDPAVVAAITRGYNGRVALTYIEWSGDGEQVIVVPWRVVGSKADAARFADDLRIAPMNRSFRTSLSSALRFSAAQFDGNGMAGASRVIDVSGDGANNDGAPVTGARDEIISRGITVNGLPIVTGLGLIGQVEVQDMNDYYFNCVIGGPGSFTIPVKDWGQFKEAVRRKLAIELSLLPPSDRPARIVYAAEHIADYDCLAGERLWKLQNGGS